MAKVIESDLFESLLIEDMLDEHLDDVLSIERLAYPYPWSRSMFISSLSSKDVCLVLVADHKLVGYAIINYILDEAHLLNICINPEFKSMGLGRLLLRELVSMAVDKKSVMFFLEVRRSNIHAISLYFSEGFNEVGVRPNYYPSDKGREDAILMTLDLSLDAFI